MTLKVILEPSDEGGYRVADARGPRRVGQR
jgi:hypothetical protein